MAGDDDVIEHAVVKIGPDLTGFRAKLDKDLEKATKGVTAKVKVVADGAGLKKSVKEAVTKQMALANQPVYRVKVVASGVGLKGSVARAVKEQQALPKQPEYKVKVVADDQHLKRTVADAGHTIADGARKAENEATRVTEEGSRRRGGILQREAAKRKNLFESTKIIDWGGQGIKPMNLLYSTIAAMTPALFAMGESALQASTSIAALGSAGIGASLALGGLLVAFRGIGDVLKLRKTVLEQDTTDQANATAATDTLAASKRGLADALREEKTAQEGIHTARREAIRDLEDLRQAVIDLDNQYKSDRISVAEARQNAQAVDRNFFATALDRARAHQDLRDAQTRLADTSLQRRQKKQDLKESVKKGVEGSDKVRAARERARDAHDSVLNARRSVATARQAGKVTSAAANLKKKIADLSPAAQEMYYWFDKNEDLFKRLQRQISQKVLPGFNKFLRALTTPPKGKKSILQTAADYAGDLGAIISKYAGKLGDWMNSPFFRSSMADIQEHNAKAFDKLGQAIEPLSDALLRIIKAAAPGFESFADTIRDLSIRFDNWIKKVEKNGGLTKWFADSRKELAKWWDIVGNILETLKNVFTASLPSGNSLVTNFQKFTQSLADWTGSPEGQKKIKDFFDRIAKLPYAKIIDFFKNATIFFLAFRTYKFLANVNPFFLALTALAAAHPEGLAQGMTMIGDALAKIMGLFVEHPKAAGALLAFVAALRVGKAIGFTIKAPILDRLRETLVGKFKVLDKFLGGGATTAVMNVNANIVNVYGKGVGTTPGAPGRTTPGRTTTTPSRTGGAPATAGAGSGLLTGAAIAAIVAAVFADQGFQRARAGDGFVDPVRRFAANPGLETLLGTAQLASPVAWAGFALGKATTKKFFGATIPDWIAAGLIGRFPALAQLQAPKIASQKATALEGNAFKRLTTDLHMTGGFNNATAQASLRTYVTRRKESVDAYVNYIRSNQGPIAAQQAEKEETDKTRVALEKLYIQYGATEEEAAKYADTAMKVGEKSKIATGYIKGYNDQLGTLSERLDEVTGEKQIVLTIKGKELLFSTLESAAAYQQVIRQGKPPTQANLQHQKIIFRKNMATGGQVDGYSPHDKADNIPAWLTAKEYVQPVSAVKYYGTDFMEAVRTRRFPRYAAGGPVDQWPFPLKVQLPREETADPGMGWAPYTGPIPKGVGALKGLTAAITGAAIRAHKALGASVSSGLRPGAITRTGNRSYHGFGRAIDLIPPSMALFNYLKSIYGKYAKEIIYTPAGNNQVWNGRNHYYADPRIRADHYNHVHLALANGGLVPAKKFDTGGTLPPGYTLAFNGTGAGETVRTQTQERAVTGPTRIDRRDLALLAHYMSGNTTPTITMDGRRVAETTNRYNYLPAGV